MGFFSDLFKKKSGKLTQEQLDEIEERVEESEKKHPEDRLMLSDLVKSAKKAVQKPKAKKVKKAAKKVAKKSVK